MVVDVVDAAWLRRTARAQRYDQDSFERAYRLAHFLGELANDEWLAERLVLKGGTCINFFHAHLPRLSVDADLNYVGSVERDVMVTERPEVEARLHDLAVRHGYKVDDVGGSYIMGRFTLRYVNVSGTPDAIKADINYLMRLSIYGVERKALPSLFDLDTAKVPCWTREEVYGSKLKALAVRGQARDLFDAAYFFEQKQSVDDARLRKAVLFYAHMDDARMGTVDLSLAEGINDRDLRAQLYPLLRVDKHPTAVAMQRVVMPRMKKMLQLQPEEKRFGDRLFAHEFAPELLFGTVAVNPQIAGHPAGLRRAQFPQRQTDDADT